MCSYTGCQLSANFPDYSFGLLAEQCAWAKSTLPAKVYKCSFNVLIIILTLASLRELYSLEPLPQGLWLLGVHEQSNSVSNPKAQLDTCMRIWIFLTTKVGEMSISSDNHTTIIQLGKSLCNRVILTS